MVYGINVVSECIAKRLKINVGANMNLKEMSVAELLEKIVCGMSSCPVCTPYKTELLLRYSEQAERIKELELDVKKLEAENDHCYEVIRCGCQSEDDKCPILVRAENAEAKLKSEGGDDGKFTVCNRCAIRRDALTIL